MQTRSTMTVYESAEAFGAIAQDEAFMGQMMPFFNDYPPFTSYIHTDAWRTTMLAEATGDIIYEVAINQVKPGRLSDFTEARAAFISAMQQAEGVGPDAAFQSFFTMPGENATEVFVGMTAWNSATDFANAAAQLMPTDAFQTYVDTFEQLAYLQVRPEDGEPFDLQQLIESGAIEFAVRTVKPGQEQLFVGKRKAFFDAIAEQPGYRFDRELVSIDSDNRVLVVAWESPADFQNALGLLAQMPEMGDSLAILYISIINTSPIDREWRDRFPISPFCFGAIDEKPGT